MINYRIATSQDADKIALLHARSWQLHYKNTFRQHFLNNRLIADRMTVWKKRFKHPSPRRYIVIAEENDQLVGFACTYLKDDPVWGALLDNLHVDNEFKRKGIGGELMKHSARWVLDNHPQSGYYLWVLQDSQPAIKFYKNLGGEQKDLVTHRMPDGSTAPAFRYVWSDLKVLL